MALLHVGLIQFPTGLIRVQGTTQNADDILLASFEYKEVHIRSLRAIYSSLYLAAIPFSVIKHMLHENYDLHGPRWNSKVT